jgi:hypothetical protein
MRAAVDLREKLSCVLSLKSLGWIIDKTSLPKKRLIIIAKTHASIKSQRFTHDMSLMLRYRDL